MRNLECPRCRRCNLFTAHENDSIKCYNCGTLLIISEADDAL